MSDERLAAAMTLGETSPIDPRVQRAPRWVVRDSVVDVADLPNHGFSYRSLMWWGTMGLIAVEGTVFALTIMAYFYLRTNNVQWPINATAPELRWGILNTAILLASMIPNEWTKRAAERYDLRTVRIGLVVCLLFAVAFLAVRVLEFTTLNCKWNSSAYGSVVWMLMGLHTVHLATDTFDTGVLTALMFTGPLEGKRYVDVSENALYWYFVVASWIPIALIVYGTPRLP